MDKRTVAQCETIRTKISEERLFQITGLRLDPAFSLAKLLWIRQYQPAIYGRTHVLLQAGDYIAARLTGQFVTEQSIASRTMLLDVDRRCWSQELLDAFEIDVARLPHLLEPGTALGPILPQVAAALDLPVNALVVSGGGDQQCNAIGAGAVAPRSASIGIGAATAPSITIDRPILDPQMRIPCCCAAVPGRWELEPPIWTTGALLRWFRDQMGAEAVAAANRQKIDPYEVLTAEAAGVPLGSDGLVTLPYFVGAGAPAWDLLARGVLFGLSLSHTRAHVIRSLSSKAAMTISLMARRRRRGWGVGGSMAYICPPRCWRRFTVAMPSALSWGVMQRRQGATLGSPRLEIGTWRPGNLPVGSFRD